MAFVSKNTKWRRYYKLSFPFCSFRNARTFNKYSIKHVISNFHESLSNSKIFPRRRNESTLKGCIREAREANIFTRRSPACRFDFARREGFMRRSIITILDPPEFVPERRIVAATANLCSCRLSLILRDSTKRAKTSVCGSESRRLIRRFTI